MFIFTLFICLGLGGLAFMAIPGLGRHGHGGVGHGSVGHGLLGHGAAHTGPHAGHGVSHGDAGAPQGHASSWTIPSPRPIFSAMALFGASGYLIMALAHPGFAVAVLASLVGALLLEAVLVTPLWNLMFRFAGKPTTPLADLLLTEAQAVTPFRNGRGVVSVIHDGRHVQMSARLQADQCGVPVCVGAKLKVQEVDPAHERLVVTIE